VFFGGSILKELTCSTTIALTFSIQNIKNVITPKMLNVTVESILKQKAPHFYSMTLFDKSIN